MITSKRGERYSNHTTKIGKTKIDFLGKYVAKKILCDHGVIALFKSPILFRASEVAIWSAFSARSVQNCSYRSEYFSGAAKLCRYAFRCRSLPFGHRALSRCSTEPAERFPPIRVTIPSRKGCYNFYMTSEIDSLQERVDAIRATGDAELAARAWHALSAVLFSYTREKTCRRRFPIIKRVTADDVEGFLSDLAEKAFGRAL
jgi:hypothetical protein